MIDAASSGVGTSYAGRLPRAGEHDVDETDDAIRDENNDDDADVEPDDDDRACNVSCSGFQYADEDESDGGGVASSNDFQGSSGCDSDAKLVSPAVDLKVDDGVVRDQFAAENDSCPAVPDECARLPASNDLNDSNSASGDTCD